MKYSWGDSTAPCSTPAPVLSRWKFRFRISLQVLSFQVRCYKLSNASPRLGILLLSYCISGRTQVLFSLSLTGFGLLPPIAVVNTMTWTSCWFWILQSSLSKTASWSSSSCRGVFSQHCLSSCLQTLHSSLLASSLQPWNLLVPEWLFTVRSSDQFVEFCQSNAEYVWSQCVWFQGSLDRFRRIALIRDSSKVSLRAVLLIKLIKYEEHK